MLISHNFQSQVTYHYASETQKSNTQKAEGTSTSTPKNTPTSIPLITIMDPVTGEPIPDDQFDTYEAYGIISRSLKGVYDDPKSLENIARIMGYTTPGLDTETRRMIAEDPKTQWRFTGEAQAFEGHDVLNLFNGNRFGNRATVDEYGMTFELPATERFMLNSWQRFNSLIENNNFLTEYDKNGNITRQYKVEPDPVEYPAEFQSIDAVGLGNMTLSERKNFLDRLQSLLDDSPFQGINARDLNLGSTVVHKSETDYFNVDFYIVVNNDHTPTNQFNPGKMSSLEKLLNSDRALREMYMKATRPEFTTKDSYGTNGSQTSRDLYTIKVTDKDGNRLPDNELIVSLNNRGVRMTFDEYQSMNREQIVGLLKGSSIKK